MAKKKEKEESKETKDLQEQYDELLEELASKDEEISSLKEDLEKQEAETQEYVSLSQRLQADFENFKKITDKRNVEIVKFANDHTYNNTQSFNLIHHFICIQLLLHL